MYQGVLTLSLTSGKIQTIFIDDLGSTSVILTESERRKEARTSGRNPRMLAQPISYQGVLTMHLVVLGAHGSYIQTLMLFVRPLSLIADPCLAAWIS